MAPNAAAGFFPAVPAWSVSVEMLELLGDCGDTARTALFRFTRMVDSGNQGYAYRAPKVRPGPFNVAQVTSRTAFRRWKWRETSEVLLREGSGDRDPAPRRRGFVPDHTCPPARMQWILVLRFEPYVNRS
ncbi:hypothetical protein GCM10010424_44410 [Streptomyces lienomycini]